MDEAGGWGAERAQKNLQGRGAFYPISANYKHDQTVLNIMMASLPVNAVLYNNNCIAILLQFCTRTRWYNWYHILVLVSIQRVYKEASHHNRRACVVLVQSESSGETVVSRSTRGKFLKLEHIRSRTGCQHVDWETESSS